MALVHIKRKLQKFPKYRIAPLISVVSGMVLVGYFVMSNFAATEPVHPDGTLVRDSAGTLNNTADDKIYLIQASQKRLVPDDKILISQGYNKSQIKNTTKADLAMPNGKNVTFKEGTIMFGNDFAPYVVDNFDLNVFGRIQNKDQARRIIDDLSVLSGMGYNYDLLRALLAGAISSNFPEKGLLIRNGQTHFDGMIVRSGKDYFVIENKNALGGATKRPIANPANQDIPNILKSHDYELRSPNPINLQKIKQATPQDLALPTNSSKLDYREGTIVKGSSTSKFIVDVDNLSAAVKLREFASDSVYSSLGYAAAEILTLTDSEINSYPRGPKVEFASMIVAPPKPPVANIVANPLKATAPAEISFSGSGSSDVDGSIAKYQWDFGDQVTGEGPKVSHYYATPGTYNAKLTVTDNSGLVASQILAVTIEASTPPAPMTSPGSPGTGYVIWDTATWSSDHLAGMVRQKPSIIRWAVSWDRQVADELKHVTNPFDGFRTVSWPAVEPSWHGTSRNTEPDKFFRRLKASCYSNFGGNGFNIDSEPSWGSYDAKRCTTLVVSQHGVKNTPFDWPASIGACPSGAASTCHWPDFNSGKLASYMQELYDILRGYLPKEKIVWEDYNEADLRWGSKKQTNLFLPGASMNFNEEWNPLAKGGNIYDYGTAPYTGGTGANWTKMHQLVKDKSGSTAPITYASGGLVGSYNYEPYNASVCPEKPGSNGKTCVNEDWVKATAPLVGYSSYHDYSDNSFMTAGPINDGTKNDFESRISDHLDLWKRHKGSDMPFYIGEIGPSSTAVIALNKNHAIALAERHAYLQDAAKSPRTAGKYVGMTFLGKVGKYTVGPWQTRYGWWDPRFDPDDVVTVTP